MSHWPGKYIIGLTGNIATGKSVVRRMLEHLGAYTIDADSLSHRAIAKGAPGYQPVIESFGKWMLDKDDEIDRIKLGNLVFRDMTAMGKLEDIVHPLVRQAVDVLVKRAGQRVIVLEAIKLLESELRNSCDSIWVTYAPEEVQVERLIRKRNMTRDEAQQRISVQSAQAEKIAAANIVIRNIGSYDDLWKQVNNAWKQVVPSAELTQPTIIKQGMAGEFSISRGKPKNSPAIADLITRLSNGKQKLAADDVMAQFGDKAYMLLLSGKNIVGVAGWQVENLVARTTELYMENNIDTARALETLIPEVESASTDLQCEASLIFAPAVLAAHEDVWKKLGYERRMPDTLGIQAWTDAALESMTKDSVLFFKQIRQDRVLRPI
ncbi:MAG: dephospho-CoA kinase [Chloroflexi bacterium]|nr:dephospho-CoA kinase [Chloroflexota bacterium]MBI3341283.1 dephospho-CoA kinase [Chloroflexota bacterium]